MSKAKPVKNNHFGAVTFSMFWLFGWGSISAQTNNGEANSSCLISEIAGMKCIPGGVFIRGSESDRTCPQGELRSVPQKKPNHRPIQEVKVSTFYMDETEVTYAAYQQCVIQKKCRPTRPRYSDYNAPQQPMVGMTWFDAHQYCLAQGKQLPTESQWEKAARGPGGELYPWGNEPSDCKRSVIKDPKLGRSCGVKKRYSYASKGKTLPVKSKPSGRYGLYDMIGNAEEWTSDWYTKDWEVCGEACAGADPKGPCASQDSAKPCKGYRRKVVRGGSWYWPASCATSWNRRPHFPQNGKPYGYHHFGFRCAASIEQAKAMDTQHQTQENGNKQ
jgi:formylglycine-generating enzyme